MKKYQVTFTYPEGSNQEKITAAIADSLVSVGTYMKTEHDVSQGVISQTFKELGLTITAEEVKP